MASTKNKQLALFFFFIFLVASSLHSSSAELQGIRQAMDGDAMATAAAMKSRPMGKCKEDSPCETNEDCKRVGCSQCYSIDPKVGKICAS